jgi:hypothetical protein
VRRLAAVVLGVVVLAALLVGGDHAATAAAEERIAERISEALDAPTEVTLHGWPLTAYAATGTIPRVDIRATDVPLGRSGVTMDHLSITLRDVRVSWDDVTGNNDGLPEAAEADFEATLTESSLQAVIGLPEELLRIRLRDGIATLDLAGLTEIRADVEADGGIVVVRLRDRVFGLNVPSEIPVDLRDQPGSPHVLQTSVGEGALVLSGTLVELLPGSGG